MLIFGLFGGALADRFDRRKLLIATQSCVLVLNIGIGLLMVFGQASGLDLVFSTSSHFSGQPWQRSTCQQGRPSCRIFWAGSSLLPASR